MEVFLSDAGNQEMKLGLRTVCDCPVESTRLTRLLELASVYPGLLASPLSQCAGCNRPKVHCAHTILLGQRSECTNLVSVAMSFQVKLS